MGAGGCGGKRRKVDVNDLGIFGVIVGKNGSEVLLASLCLQKFFRDLVVRED